MLLKHISGILQGYTETIRSMVEWLQHLVSIKYITASIHSNPCIALLGHVAKEVTPWAPHLNMVSSSNDDQETRCASSNNMHMHWYEEKMSRKYWCSNRRLSRKSLWLHHCWPCRATCNDSATIDNLQTITACFTIIHCFSLWQLALLHPFCVGNLTTHVGSLLHVLLNHWSGTLFDIAGLPVHTVHEVAGPLLCRIQGQLEVHRFNSFYGFQLQWPVFPACCTTAHGAASAFASKA